MVLYVDLVVLLNFLVDLLLILGTNRLAGYPPGLKRAVPAALLGGAYAGGCCCRILISWEMDCGAR